MEASVVEYISKIELLLEKLHKGESESVSDEILNKLLITLWWEDKIEVKSSICIFKEWIFRAVTTWNTSKIILQANILSFILSLAGLLLKNEERFNDLNHHNFLIKLIGVTQARESETPNSIHLAYINLLSSFLEHKSGIEWIVSSNFWEDIFELSLKNKNDDVIQESTQFLKKILDCTIDHDERFCDRVVKRIMFPLGENVHRSIKVSNDVSDEIAVEFLHPVLKLIGSLLEKFLKEMYLEGKNLGVVLLFLKNFYEEERICDFMAMAQKQCLLFDLSKVMFMMQFIDLYGKVITNSTTLSKVATSVNRLGDNFMSHLSKCSFLEQVEFCNFGIFYWKLIDSKIPSFQIAVTSKRQVRQSDQPVILLANAGFCLLVKHVATLDVLKQKTIHDQFLYQFTEKVGNMMCVPLIRICLFWQKNAVEDPDLFRICSRSLEIVKESRHYLTRDQAVIFFQGLTYVLRNIVQATRECPEKLEVFFQESSYIHQVFELLGLLIEDFHFVLKDGIESTYVMSICLDFLNLTEWPSEVLVQIIGLIGIATAHYMAPNMALLFENGVDTTLDLLGPVLRSKLLDKRPEVIKAALKVVFTVVNTSCSKSKSFK